MVYLGLTEVNTENFKFSTDVFADSEVVQSMKEATFEQRRAAIKAGLLVLGFPLVIALGFAVLAYSLSTFFDERKDKSIIFWRSLPVSDSFTVFSKLSLDNALIFITCKLSVTCESDFCPTNGASTPGVDLMNCSNPTDGDISDNPGLSFAQSSNFPCINGTLVKTPMFNCLAESNIDADLSSTS